VSRDHRLRGDHSPISDRPLGRGLGIPGRKTNAHAGPSPFLARRRPRLPRGGGTDARIGQRPSLHHWWL